MKISILGLLKPTPTYEEWENIMLEKFAAAEVTELIVTASESTLNSYVARFCKAHGLKLNEIECCPDKEHRNKRMVDESDLTIFFVSEEPQTKKVAKIAATDSNKDAIIIVNKKVFKTISFTPTKNQAAPIRKEELISEKEELDLIKLAQNGDKLALNRLIDANRRFVTSVARTHLKKNPSITLDELITKGNKGLERACLKFDPSRGFKFLSFATWFVRKAITDALPLTPTTNFN